MDMALMIKEDFDPEILKEVNHYWQIYTHLSRQFDKKQIKEIEFENKIKKQADVTTERILLLDSTYTKSDIFKLIMQFKPA